MMSHLQWALYESIGWSGRADEFFSLSRVVEQTE